MYSIREQVKEILSEIAQKENGLNENSEVT